jgi:hypothetical protein
VRRGAVFILERRPKRVSGRLPIAGTKSRLASNERVVFGSFEKAGCCYVSAWPDQGPARRASAEATPQVERMLGPEGHGAYGA